AKQTGLHSNEELTEPPGVSRGIGCLTPDRLDFVHRLWKLAVGASPPVVAQRLCRWAVTGRLAPFRWCAVGAIYFSVSVISEELAEPPGVSRGIGCPTPNCLDFVHRLWMLAVGRVPSGRRPTPVPLGCHRTA